MSRLDDLSKEVRGLYDTKVPGRSDWADWLADNHVFVVAQNAKTLAQRFAANEEFAQAAGMLHDIADAKINRFDEQHEAMSLQLAKELMLRVGFTAEEIVLVVDDAIRYHSCHDGNVPKSLEGKILATADAQAHLQTNFYIYGTWAKAKEGDSLNDIKAWALKKLDRDFNDKILFSEVQAECRANYDCLKMIFSR